jgi:hypothetical protein
MFVSFKWNIYSAIFCHCFVCKLLIITLFVYRVALELNEDMLRNLCSVL